MLLHFVVPCFYQDDDDDDDDGKDDDDVSGDIGLDRVNWIVLRPLLNSFVGALSG